MWWSFTAVGFLFVGNNKVTQFILWGLMIVEGFVLCGV